MRVRWLVCRDQSLAAQGQRKQQGREEGCVVPEHWNLKTAEDQGTNDSFQEASECDRFAKDSTSTCSFSPSEQPLLPPYVSRSH
jgi:hypothetical protein